MTTPLYPIVRKRVEDGFAQIIKQQITPWSFLTAGPPFRIKMFDGQPISYGGIGFEGSPRRVFWTRYIEPFLEHLCISEIAAAIAMAKAKEVDARPVLLELKDLLLAGCRQVYANMADVDRRLRGKGFPDKVELRSVNYEYSSMGNFIEEHIRAELAMYKTRSFIEVWYARNPSLVWLIGIVVGVAGVLATIL